ncbi:MAG: leucine-rich repeat domain-containing protein, partial [Bacteroidales bacterium]|nr:leucine-rich repeat domain-containing protein [Bacteroidales bacterium]
MKKSLSIVVMFIFAVTVVAQTFDYGKFSYTVTKAPTGNLRGECQLNGVATGATASGSLVIDPSAYYNGVSYNVVSVKDYAFKGNNSITSVRFPYGMRTIGVEAFQKCTKLESIYVPTSVTSVGARAFNGCSAFKNYYTAQARQIRVTYGSDAFPSNSGMKMYFPNGDAWTAGDQDRMFDTSGRSILCYDIYMNDGTVAVVETPATKAGETHKCTIVGFNPNGSQAPEASNGVKYYKPTNAISSPIGYEFRFEYTKIGKHAFMDSEMPFARLQNLTSLTTIGDEAFYNSKVGSITLPKNLTTLGQAVFRHTIFLTGFEVSSDNTNFWTSNGILYGKDITGNKELVCVPFRTVYHTVNVQPVHTIREYAFEGFQWSNSAIHIPYGLKEIKSHAFEETNIHSYLNIPSSVTILHTDWMNNCWFTDKAEFVMNISNKTIMNSADLNAANVGIYAGAKLYVPREVVADYKASKTWSKFSSVNPDYKT